MTRSAHALAACLVAVLAAPAFTQDARERDSVGAYRALVTDYRRFGRAPVERLFTFPPEAVRVAVDSAESAPPAGWDWPDLRGAAMLHTEVWFVARSERGRGDAAFHLATAERLLGAVTAREPQQRYFAERWCRTVAELLRSDNSAASNVKERCARRWPLSPPEARARSEYETTVRSEAMFFSTVEARLYARDGNFRAQPDILRFVDLYNTVLSEDPRYAPAALRLGNLRSALGNDTLASESFTQASRSPDPRDRYLAFLFIGGIHDRAGRLDDAERFYVEAMQQYPSAQSAALALAELLGRRGRDVESKRLLSEVLAPGRGRVVDPFWTFLLPAEISPALSFDELRIEVMQ